MNALQEIVNIMSADDRQAFISHLNRKNKREDVLNITLFKSLETDDINVQKKLEASVKTPAALHALRKRLYDSLIEFTGNRRFADDTSAEHEVLRLIVVARIFFEQKMNKEAFKCLRKAEDKAVAIENFSLLNEIYQAFIQFAHLDTSLNLELIIEKYNANRSRMEQEEQMNVAYALLRRELADIYHNGKVIDFTAFIKGTMERQGVSPDALTFRSLYQILFIANEYASINSNYKLIEPFMESAYRFIEGREALGERHLYYHIYILYLLANMHFRNRRFSESGKFLDLMEEQMNKQGKRYYSRFYMRHTLLGVLNKNYSGNPGMAIDIAEKALKKNAEANDADTNDLRLALLVFYLQQSDRTAFKLMVKFGHSDSWYEKKMGMDWAIKKKLVEVLLHAHFENTELALSQLKSFRRRYKKYLQEVKEHRALDYLSLVEQYLTKPEIIKFEKFSKSLAAFTEHIQDEDLFVVSFIGWLKAKAEKRPVYETILELMVQS
jgi:hypothetical protein